MKKSFLLIVPALLCLTSCQEFKIGLDDGYHSSGLDKSISGQNSANPADEYKTFSGDIFNTDKVSSVDLTFANFSDNLSDISDVDAINSYIVSSLDNFFLTVEGPSNVGTKENDGLFLGADSRYADGYLTFSFKEDIKYVAITATPYYYVNTAWNEDDLIVDENVGISVNSSLYIPLVSTIDQESQKVKETVCKYDVSNKEEDKNKISLRVKQRRAFLRKITLYY